MNKNIDDRILSVRGYRVMLDSDLAELYGVSTKRLNEQVKRNSKRFPKDFMFRLTAQEKTEVVANCDHLAKLRFSPVMPYAFTEHGTIMLASVLNSRIAVQASIQVVRAFIRFRSILGAHKELARKIDGLERNYDEKFRIVFIAIKRLMKPPPEPDELEKPPIGFLAPSSSNSKKKNKA